MRRKTMIVAEIKQFANEVLQSSKQDQEFRFGIITMVERILMDSGNYRGYRYLDTTELPEDVLPGVVTITEGEFSFPDETRRSYF
jgi:hypothetical protein